ncbi:unnamed protein product [Fraxinus pennsylvanica]|uniref:Uncharacterized protein n=1 Tax=Fraxinus pennsylvanica TaxID=56036 RepID=A0AAD2EG13_9LAMI|nr:unnamed protein product [Fraxinus pennsylvanica]
MIGKVTREYDSCIEKDKLFASTSSKKIGKYARGDDAIVHALELESACIRKDHRDWFKKPKRVKAFHWREYDSCIKKAKLSTSTSSNKMAKYACRDDAIVHALELENACIRKDHPYFLSRTHPQEITPLFMHLSLKVLAFKKITCIYFSSRTHTQGGGPWEHHDVDESLSPFDSSEESKDFDKDSSSSEYDLDSAFIVSFNELNHACPTNKQTKSLRTPNDPKDDRMVVRGMMTKGPGDGSRDIYLLQMLVHK